MAGRALLALSCLECQAALESFAEQAILNGGWHSGPLSANPNTGITLPQPEVS